MTTPVPDPTKLTTDAVNAATDISRRELASVRELLETRLLAMDKATELLAATVGKVPSDTDKAVVALKDLLGARIDGMDTATTLLASQVNTIPSETDKRISALREILDGEIRLVQNVAQEKFTAIEGTFSSNALALTAALAAQKEAAAEQNKSNTLAITKSEKATSETIAANAAQNTAAAVSQAATVADLKERLVRLESGGVATATALTERRADQDVGQNATYYRSMIYAAAFSGLASLVAIVLTIVLHH
jgi:hypothetical protein